MVRRTHQSGNADQEYLLDHIGTAFSKLRRRTMSAPVDPPVAPTDLRRDLVLTVVEESDGGLSVKTLATMLMMERSVVSRLVGWCVAQGLLERVASQADGRSVTLQLTQQGSRVLSHSRQQQRQAFEYITDDWSDTDRFEFARLLHRYAQASSSIAASTNLPPST